MSKLSGLPWGRTDDFVSLTAVGCPVFHPVLRFMVETGDPLRGETKHLSSESGNPGKTRRPLKLRRGQRTAQDDREGDMGVE